LPHCVMAENLHLGVPPATTALRRARGNFLLLWLFSPSLNPFLSASSTSFLSPPIIQICSSSLLSGAGTACSFPAIPSPGRTCLLGPSQQDSVPLFLL
uniref:Uncharacterized protein n=1 Tax=Falco tinnunculus TaxID=100819 RepID=A0A8C4TQA5_FALTI